jgi:hypothetical protein
MGRLLEQWEFPIGNKTIQNPELPSYIRNGSQEVKISYLREMVPEDGSFKAHKGMNFARFSVSRSVALDAGNKNEMYQFKPKVAFDGKQFIQAYAVQEVMFGRSLYYRLSYSRLKELTENPKIGQTARQLLNIVEKTPVNLLLGELSICKDLGIKMTTRIEGINFYPESGRVSLQKRIATKKNEDAIRWALLAPPNDFHKRKKVEDWLKTQNPEEASLI